MFGPTLVLFRFSRVLPVEPIVLQERVRAHLGGHDWTGPRDRFIGKVTDHSFEVRRVVALQTPVRCIARGVVSAAGTGAAVSVEFCLPVFLLAPFWGFPFLFFKAAIVACGMFGLIVAITLLAFAREVRATRALLNAVLSGHDVLA
jgi:hypothetical protein